MKGSARLLSWNSIRAAERSEDCGARKINIDNLPRIK
jgi:hypothetical protein